MTKIVFIGAERTPMIALPKALLKEHPELLHESFTVKLTKEFKCNRLICEGNGCEIE